MISIHSRSARIGAVVALSAGIALVSSGASGFRSNVFALQGFSLSAYSVVTGGAITGTATLAQTTPAVTMIAFRSSSSAASPVAASLPVQPNGAGATVLIRGMTPGCADITASHGGTTRTQQMVVHPAPGSSSLTMSVPERLLLLGALPVTGVLNIPGAALGSQTAALTSSNQAVVTVPASRVLVRGRATFPITITGEGCAVITARIGAQTVGKTVRSIYIGG